jgi:hypothetical protein
MLHSWDRRHNASNAKGLFYCHQDIACSILPKIFQACRIGRYMEHWEIIFLQSLSSKAFVFPASRQFLASSRILRNLDAHPSVHPHLKVLIDDCRFPQSKISAYLGFSSATQKWTHIAILYDSWQCSHFQFFCEFCKLRVKL